MKDVNYGNFKLIQVKLLSVGSNLISLVAHVDRVLVLEVLLLLPAVSRSEMGSTSNKVTIATWGSISEARKRGTSCFHFKIMVPVEGINPTLQLFSSEARKRVSRCVQMMSLHPVLRFYLLQMRSRDLR